MAFDPRYTFSKLDAGDMDSIEVLNECKKLRVDVSSVDELATQKLLLKKCLLEEILKIKNLDQREVIVNMLIDVKNQLKLKTVASERGYSCFFVGCRFLGSRHRQYINHLKRVHPRQESYCCRFKNVCQRNFNSICDLEDHILSEHFGRILTNVIKPTTNILPSILPDSCKCIMVSCGQRRFKSPNELIKHLNKDHSKEPRFCIFADCLHFFAPGSESRKHFKSRHSLVSQTALKTQNRIYEIAPTIDNDVSLASSIETDVDGNWFETNSSADEDDESEDLGLGSYDELIIHMMGYADFLNSLTCNKYVPLTVVKEIAEEYLALARKSLKQREDTLRGILQKTLNIKKEEIERIVSELSSNDLFLKTQEELLSDHKRINFIERHFKYVKPIEIVLNPEEVKKGAVKDCLHYVPILKSLKVLLEDETFVKVYERHKECNQLSPQSLLEMHDGSAVKENEFFRIEPEAFSLLLYSDAVELTNPLGSGRLKHKIVQVFWAVADLPRRHRSKIDKLQLGLVFKEKLLKKYSIDKVFKMLIDDLKFLENTGIMLDKPRKRTVKAGLLAYSADNLEASIIGGFSASFSSKDICRFCHCQYTDLQSNIHQCQTNEGLALWTVEEYDMIVNSVFPEQNPDHCDQLVTRDNLFNEYEEPSGESEDDSDANSHYSSSDEVDDDRDGNINHGLKSKCVFNQLKAFHCVTSMPPDCLHDLFEGVVAQDLLAIIRILQNKKWYTLAEYNDVLKRFPVSSQEASNKPQMVPVSTSTKKLNGKAVSIWCHLRFFLPMLHQNLLIQDPDDDILKLAVLLTEVTQRITAEKFEFYEVNILEEKVMEYLDFRQVLLEEYPSLGTPKPKHHFLCHYGTYIRKFGPPLGFWTGRYESKHRVAKTIAVSSKNFRNISLTVATRQQLRMASVFYKGMYDYADFKVPLKVRKKVELTESEIENNLKTVMTDDDLLCDEVVWRDRRYSVGSVVVIGREDMLIMTVGIIKAILLRRDRVLLLVRRALLVQNKYKFFSCNKVEDFQIFVDIENLEDTYPLLQRGCDDNFYVIPHHHISFKYS